MTEEEIRIIVDRVFTELRNNSKTIMQLSEKTEVDNCWFEIENGYRISLKTLISKFSTIAVFDKSFSGLDNFNSKDKCNIYKIIRNGEFNGILIVSELSNSAGFVQFLMGSFYINPSTGSLDGVMGSVPNDVKPNIVCRRYINGQWSKWQYFQETFLSDDGSGTNTLVAPTLKYFVEQLKLYYTKKEADNNFTKKDSVNAVRDISINQLSDLDTYTPHNKSGIYNVLMFGGTKHVGVLYVYNFQAPQHGGLQVFLSTFNYNNPGQSSLSMPSIIYRSTDYNNTEKWLEWKPYQTTFISQDGTVPENGGAIGLNESNMAPSLSFLYKKTDYPKVVEWSGIVEDDADIEDAGTGLEGQIVYISLRNTFAYKVELPYEGGTAYYAYFDGLEKFQNKRYDSSPDFVADFTKNIFKGADGSIWIADSATSIKIVSKTLDVIDGEYHEDNKEAFQHIADTLLASSNFLARILYHDTGDKSKELVFFNGCIPERNYGFSTVYPLMIVGISATGKIFMMHRYDKQIEIFKVQ